MRHEVRHRLHVAQRSVRSPLGQPVELSQRLQLTIPGGHRVEQPLREAKSAEPRDADWLNAESQPFRLQNFLKVIIEVVRNEGTAADIETKIAVDGSSGVAVPFEYLSRVAVNAGRL